MSPQHPSPCPATSRLAGSTGRRRFLGLLAALALLTGGAFAVAAADLFTPVWYGYDVGSSAFPGNPEPFERDPTAMALADFDGDGWLDVAVANYEYAAPGGGTDGLSGFVVLFNRQDGSYGEPVHTTVSSAGCWDIVAADFDGDDDQDIAVSVANAFFEGSTVRVYRNDGNGAFTSFLTLSAPGDPIGLAAADLDGDLDVDLAVACYDQYEPEGTVRVFMNQGTGVFAAGQPYLVPWRPWKLEAGDLDGSGRADLAVAHEGQTVSLLFNAGDGSFGTPVVHDALFPMQGGMSSACIALADTDRDGDLDIFYGNTRSNPVAQSGRIVHLRNEGGTFVREADIILTSNTAGPVDITAGDFDGDDWPDLVAVHHSGRASDGPWLILNDGAGGFLTPDLRPAGQGTFAAALGDSDGDGDLDLLTADRYSMMVTVHENLDGALRDVGPIHPTAFVNIRLDVGDVDGDGDLDVFTSTESTGGPGALLRNLGDGSFAAPVEYTHSSTYGRGAGRAKLRDLDGDGDLDLLYNDPHTDYHNGYDFHVALNDGDGNFGPIVEWDLNTCGNGDVDAFDLDGDGDLDVVNLEELACAGAGGDRLYISLNNGDATFAPAITVAIDLLPHNVAGGHFNADAHIDLVTVHWMPYGFRNFINVHLGNGDGSFQEELRYDVGQGPRWVVVSDLDGDEILDIATAGTGDGDVGRETLTVLFGNGNGTFGGRSDYYAPYSPDLLGATGLAACDIDQDGDPDLLMSTVANGMALYRNDGFGNFTSEPRLGFWWDPWSVVCADFTGDSVADLGAQVANEPAGIAHGFAVLPGAGTTTAVEDDEPIVRPRNPYLSAIYPNPIGSTARFSLRVPGAQDVDVKLYDLRGRLVRQLYAGSLAEGEARQFSLDRGDLPSGLYFLRVKGATFTATSKMMVVR